MTIRFPGKLCKRNTPERGCLARVNSSPPTDGCPILALPAEIRAQIFECVVADADLIFELSETHDIASTWSTCPTNSWALAFLSASRIFEAEALALVKIRSLCIRAEPPQDISTDKIAHLQQRPKRTRAPPIALTLGTTQKHLRHLTIDTGAALKLTLQSDLLQSFPRLRTIRFKHELWPRELELSYVRTFRSALAQQRLVRECLTDCAVKSTSSSRSRPAYSADRVSLNDLLDDPRLKQFQPLRIDLSIHANLKPETNRIDPNNDDWTPYYPIKNAVYGLRMSFEWPSRRVTDLEADMYSQPMALAVKTRWTEKLPVTEAEEAEILT